MSASRSSLCGSRPGNLDAYLASEVARPKLLYADCYEKLDVNKFR